MRIAMITRATLYSTPGGDTVQINGTAKYIKKLGAKVEVFTSGQKIPYENFDLLHFFNITRPCDLLIHGEKCRLPIVMSPIYIDYGEFEKKARSGFYRYIGACIGKDRVEYAKTVARFFLNGEKLTSPNYLWLGQRASINKLLKSCAMLLPNSKSEQNRLCSRFPQSCDIPFKVVPNAIDTSVFDRNVELDPTYNDAVICVAKIEGAKNQLSLIRALNGSNLQLHIVGKPSANNTAYYEQCKNEAGSNIHFADFIPHEKLSAIYKAAKVHVLPSWFETTGLSSLEAGYFNCNLVVTDKGDQKEYFKDHAIFCDPGDISSIRNAVEKAHNLPKSHKFQKIIEDSYTWEKAALVTMDAYSQVIGS